MGRKKDDDHKKKKKKKKQPEIQYLLVKPHETSHDHDHDDDDDHHGHGHHTHQQHHIGGHHHGGFIDNTAYPSLGGDGHRRPHFHKKHGRALGGGCVVFGRFDFASAFLSYL